MRRRRPALAAALVRFERIQGFDAKGTPARYDKVGVLEVGPRNAPNILILNPGTSASAAYFAPLAKTLVRKAKGWQVWAVERMENLLEDGSVLNRAKRGTASRCPASAATGAPRSPGSSTPRGRPAC